jgi:hypothetical protein
VKLDRQYMLQVTPGRPPRTKKTHKRVHIESFFAKYTDFEFDRTQSTMSEFTRLSQQRNWDPDSSDSQLGYEARRAKKQLKDALVVQFNATFGTDEKDLNSWRELCRVIGIPAPNTLAECQAVNT